MIQAALRLLSAEVRGMHAAAYVLGASALASSVLALVRDRLLAGAFGAGLSLDVYYAAFRIPDIIFVLFASLFSAYVLIPELARREPREQRAYLDTIAVGFAVLMVVVSFGAFIVAPWMLGQLFPTLMSSAMGATLVSLTRLLLLQPILLGVSNICAAVTQSAHRYTLYAVAPILYNIGIIIGILFLYPLFGLIGIGYGVIIGALLHVGIQIPTVIHEGFWSAKEALLSPRVVWDTMSTSLPRTAALAMGQLLVVGLLALGGTLREGSIAVFILAMNLQSVPLAVIGASYSVAAFPTLSKLFAHGESHAFVEQVVDAARHIMFWTLPAIGLLIVLRAHVVRIVLGSGSFDWTDTRLTAATLAILAIALLAQALTLLVARAYYAAGKSYTPFVVQSAGAAVSLVAAFALLRFLSEREYLRFAEELLRVADVPGVEVLALPAAFAGGTLLTTMLLITLFERSFGGFVAGVGRVFWESLTATGIAGVAAYATLNVLGGISEATTLSTVVLHGASAGIVGLLAAVITYALLGSREFAEVYVTLAKRSRPHEPVQSAESQITS